MARSGEMPTSLFLLLPLLLFSLAALFAPSAAVERPPPTALAKTMCNATVYRDLCLRSLSFLPTSQAGSHIKLARGALSLSLDSAKAATARLSALAGESSPVLECERSMEDCVDLLLQSVGDMDRLTRPGSADFGEHVQHVQAWVGAAAADTGACLENLARAKEANGKGLDGLMEVLTHAMQMTSNAESIVKSLAPQQNKADKP